MLKAALAALALALATPAVAAPAPVRIVLVGDSTVADKAGWGGAFCADAGPQVTCVNKGKGGRSSLSYRSDGTWDKVVAILQQPGPWKATYVLIQFGHNDNTGGAGRATDLSVEFPVNLARYVREVRAAGATPILVTPLARREFRKGQLHEDLAPWAAATRRAAGEQKAPLLDLYADSAAAVRAMGPTAADTLAMAPPGATGGVDANGASLPKFDYTHLGPKGAQVFGRIVEKELVAAVPVLKPHFAK